MFDILDNQKGIDFETFLTFDKQGQKLYSDTMFDQMKQIGYDTTNAIILLSTMTIVITIYISKFFVCVFAWISYNATGKGRKLYLKLQYEVFY